MPAFGWCMGFLCSGVGILIKRRQANEPWTRLDWLGVLMFAVGAIIWTQI